MHGGVVREIVAVGSGGLSPGKTPMVYLQAVCSV